MELNLEPFTFLIQPLTPKKVSETTKQVICLMHINNKENNAKSTRGKVTQTSCKNSISQHTLASSYQPQQDGFLLLTLVPIAFLEFQQQSQALLLKASPVFRLTSHQQLGPP